LNKVVLHAIGKVKRGIKFIQGLCHCEGVEVIMNKRTMLTHNEQNIKLNKLRFLGQQLICSLREIAEFRDMTQHATFMLNSVPCTMPTLT